MIPFYWVSNYYRLHNHATSNLLETPVQDQIKFFQRIGVSFKSYKN